MPAHEVFTSRSVRDCGEGGADPVREPLPNHFRLAEVGSDYLLGSWRDRDDDVEHVRAYRVRFARP